MFQKKEFSKNYEQKRKKEKRKLKKSVNRQFFTFFQIYPSFIFYFGYPLLYLSDIVNF